MSLAQLLLIPGLGGATTAPPPLDSITPSAVFSTRKTRTAYAGNCMLVRRSSDDTTQAIGFSNGLLDTTALLAFCGGGNGFVRTWYDQSGNGYDATQTTNGNQPQIVSSGTVITLNGGAHAVEFIAGSSTRLQTAATIANVATAAAWTAFASTNVTSFIAGNPGAGADAGLVSDAGAYWKPLGEGGLNTYYGTLTTYQYAGSDKSRTIAAISGQDYILASRLSGGTLSCILNGLSETTLASGNIGATTDLIHLGQNYSSAAKYNGKASEIYLFASALDNTTRDTVGAAMGSYASVAWKPSKIYMGEGDSITLGTGASNNSYVDLIAADATYGGLFTKTLKYAKGSSPVSGTNLGLVERSAAIDAQLPTSRGVLSVLIGANDHSLGHAVGDFLTALASYLDARRSAGWKVIACTLTPNTDAGFSTFRATANAEILTWSGTHADAICDFAADATIGPDAAASDTNKYVDGVHPSASTQAIMKTIMAPIVASLA